MGKFSTELSAEIGEVVEIDESGLPMYEQSYGQHTEQEEEPFEEQK